MKNLLLTLVVFVYTVPDNFNFAKFLVDAEAAGIKLYALNKADSPNGDVMLQGNTLTVRLHDDSTPMLPADLKKFFRGQAGRAALPSDPKTGGLKIYKAAVTAAVQKNLK